MLNSALVRQEFLGMAANRFSELVIRAHDG